MVINNNLQRGNFGCFSGGFRHTGNGDWQCHKKIWHKTTVHINKYRIFVPKIKKDG
jgi:hypothetical protein